MNPRLSADELKEFYKGEYVSTYEAKPLYRIIRLLPFLDIAKTDHVADFACGNGMLLDILHDKVASYVGVDFSEEFIVSAEARARRVGAGNATFVCGDIVSFCASHQRAFDKAFTLDFSEHIYDDVFITVYTAIRSSLKPGGMLYLHTPNAEYVLEICKAKGIMKQFPEHIAVRSADQYRLLLEKIGFTSFRVKYLAHYLAPMSYFHFLSRLPIIGKYFKARLFLECKA